MTIFFFGKDGGLEEEVVDTDKDEDQEVAVWSMWISTNEDEDLDVVKDEGLKGSEEDGDFDEEEDWQLYQLWRIFIWKCWHVLLICKFYTEKQNWSFIWLDQAIWETSLFSGSSNVSFLLILSINILLVETKESLVSG